MTGQTVRYCKRENAGKAFVRRENEVHESAADGKGIRGLWGKVLGEA